MRRATTALPRPSCRWMIVALAALSLCACRGLPQSTADPKSVPTIGDSERAQLSLSDAPYAAGSEPAPPIEPSFTPVIQQATHLSPIESSTYQYQAATPISRPAMAPPASHATTYSQGDGMLPGYAPPACIHCAGDEPPHRWRPPGIAGPWPRGEYLCDGQDSVPHVAVDPDFTVRGLAQEDTVVHCDTLDGQVLVEPSNQVCLYAPRFAAVRKVSGLLAHERHLAPGGFDLPTRLVQGGELQIASTVLQPVQSVQQMGTDGVVIFRERLLGVGLDNLEGLSEYEGDLLPYEDFRIVRSGEMLNSEKARLASRSEAALVWTTEQAVQVVVDEVEAIVQRGAFALGSANIYETPPGDPRMRIVKLASSSDAVPGEVVEFTLRFDNVGNQPVGNVTILDNLTTRLEYVPESSTCTLDAEFFATVNEGDSLILRWEIIEPLPVGAGGVIRFKCRVR